MVFISQGFKVNFIYIYVDVYCQNDQHFLLAFYDANGAFKTC